MVLWLRGIEPRLSKDDEFRENREGRKEEMDCLWMTTTAMAAFIWIQPTPSELHLLLACLLVSSPMVHTWILWIGRELDYGKDKNKLSFICSDISAVCTFCSFFWTRDLHPSFLPISLLNVKIIQYKSYIGGIPLQFLSQALASIRGLSHPKSSWNISVLDEILCFSYHSNLPCLSSKISIFHH